MWNHPFIESKKRQIQTLLFVLLAMLSYGVMLYFYSDFDLLHIVGDAFLSITLLVVFGYLFWFVVDVIRSPQADIILSVFVLIVWVTLIFLINLLIVTPLNSLFYDVFLHTLPFRLVTVGLIWTVLLLWYRNVKLLRWKAGRLLDDAIQTPMETVIDRIAVKNSNRIHIIPVNELLYVQACGDYVMLFSSDGEFLKEQTMKSLEQHLPTNFVRIHRSYIVNVEQIQRVELFGKESYNVYLKTGASLRASSGGYKLLKEQLSL